MNFQSATMASLLLTSPRMTVPSATFSNESAHNGGSRRGERPEGHLQNSEVLPQYPCMLQQSPKTVPSHTLSPGNDGPQEPSTEGPPMSGSHCPLSGGLRYRQFTDLVLNGSTLGRLRLTTQSRPAMLVRVAACRIGALVYM